MSEKLVELLLIKDNPYQGRQAYEDIDLLGRSIAIDGLQEMPKARVTPPLTPPHSKGRNGEGNTYQLKFGHRRREAFRWLAANWQKENLPDRYDGYKVMPLDIEELTDEEMFRGAVIENEQRKNLNPIEQAEMMLVYKDRFKKSSDEIGQLFGMSGATVRGLVRLLELPAAVKDKIASGEISQGAARKLLTIARVDESQIESAVKNFAAGESAEDVIENAMRRSDSAFTMHNSWSDGTPRAGQGLWGLDTKAEKFPSSYLPDLKAADVAKALELEFTADLRTKIEDYIVAAKNHPEYVSQFGETHKVPEDVEIMERIGHLLTPPSCTGCVFHAVADRTHYCGFKACHSRKRAAWVRSEMEKLSKKLKIAIYDPAKDGKAVLPLVEGSYNDEGKKHAKLVADNDPDLRLQPHKNEYSLHKWTDSNLVRVILVGKKVTAVKEKKREAASSEQARVEAQRKQAEMERAFLDASRKFTTEYAIKIFAAAFKGFENIPVLCALAGVRAASKNAKKADVLAELHGRLARKALDNLDGYDWRLLEKGPAACAKYLQGVATAWGLKLPADFAEVAKGYTPVSAETEEKKGKVKK